MLRGDEIWSQGMSEPDAGSDLASFRTGAVRDGDEFVLNGQKTWNSLGAHGRLVPALRAHRSRRWPNTKASAASSSTSGRPGIEVRPLRTITGDQPFAELFFTDVRVPASALLGPLHEGWTVAMTTLSFERAGVARLHLGLSKKLDHLLAEPGAARAAERSRASGTGWPASTPTSPACGG